MYTETVTLSEANLQALSTDEEIQECEIAYEQFLAVAAQYGEDAASGLDKRLDAEADPDLVRSFNQAFGNEDLGVEKWAKTPHEDLLQLLGELSSHLHLNCTVQSYFYFCTPAIPYVMSDCLVV